MSGTRCEHCGKVTTAGKVCVSCIAQVLAVLSDVPDMIDQLRLALSRQTKFGPATLGRSSGETPVVFNPRASDASIEFARTLLRWQGRLADHLNPARTPATAKPPYRISEPVRFVHPITAARWMHDQIVKYGIGGWVDAARMVKALVAAEAKVEEVIDRPEPLVFLGECELDNDGQPCGGRVYAERDAVRGECNLCGGTCDAEEQRLRLLTWMDARYLTAAEIARVATYLGLTINREQVRKRINQWHRRGRIVAGVDAEDHAGEGDAEGPSPTFLFAEVRRLLVDDEEERQRRTKRAG